jgi:hypothetical protein
MIANRVSVQPDALPRFLHQSRSRSCLGRSASNSSNWKQNRLVYINAIFSSVSPREFSARFQRQLKIYSRGLEDEAEDDLSYFAA